MPKRVVDKSEPASVSKFAPLSQPLDELPPRPGKAKCLKCSNSFDSEDVIRLRICPNCTVANAKIRVPKVTSSYLDVDGRTVHLSPEGD